MIRLACFAVLLFALPLAHAAEPVATVRVAFDRAGITDTRLQGFADQATGRRITAGDPVAQLVPALLAPGGGITVLVGSEAYQGSLATGQAAACCRSC